MILCNAKQNVEFKGLFEKKGAHPNIFESLGRDTIRGGGGGQKLSTPNDFLFWCFSYIKMFSQNTANVGLRRGGIGLSRLCS